MYYSGYLLYDDVIIMDYRNNIFIDFKLYLN